MEKRTWIPPGGMGNGLERAYSEKIFIISGYNIRKIIWILLVLIQDETKALQNAKIKDYSKKGRPLGDSDGPKATFKHQLLLFLLDMLKYSELIRMKYAQKHFESTFGSTHF